MTTDLPLVLGAVEQLDAEFARLTHQATSLDAPASDDAPAVVKLRKSLQRADRALRSLRESVLDSAAELTVERFESAFRARSVVLQLQLHKLKQMEPQVAHRLWPASGRFQSVDDVAVFLLDRIGRLNAAWSEARRGHKTQNESQDHRAVIAAVATAEHALIAIGKDRDVISFLAVGAALTCEDFRTPCRVIAALLDVSLAPLPPLTRRSLQASSLVRRLSKHATTFSTLSDEEDLDG